MKKTFQSLATACLSFGLMFLTACGGNTSNDPNTVTSPTPTAEPLPTEHAVLPSEESSAVYTVSCEADTSDSSKVISDMLYGFSGRHQQRSGWRMYAELIKNRSFGTVLQHANVSSTLVKATVIR